MGGSGSGKQGWHNKVEDSRCLDIFRLKELGCLKPGYFGGLNWSTNGEKVASINLHVDENKLHLNYRSKTGYSDWQDVKEPIQIVDVTCAFGGTRPYFICPGIVNGRACWRRVAKLYLSGKFFLCRHCHDLRYTSQGENGSYRAMRRANTVRNRLGGKSGAAWGDPPKPKGMWWRTYWRQIERINEAEYQADLAFIAYATRRGWPGT